MGIGSIELPGFVLCSILGIPLDFCPFQPLDALFPLPAGGLAKC